MSKFSKGLYCLIFILLFVFPCYSKSSKVKLKKDWFYVDGEKFFIKGIGYSNYRPKEHPRAGKINLVQEKEDFIEIRKAGFNTIRTWSPLSLEELKLADEQGLFVIQGNWIEYRDNFADKDKLSEIVESLKSNVMESLEASNVIMYLVGNEPQPKQVFSIGLKQTNSFFKELKESIKDISSKLPVSMSNWVQSDFLDDYMWDIASLNIYSYNPESVSHAIGYRGYVDWFKRVRAKGRPFVITEFGLSVSKSSVGHKGYGGNTEEEQRDGIIAMYKDAISGGVNGICVFEWIDEWWKNYNHPSDYMIHEPNDPEEWFGICYYDEEGKLNKRPVFEALKTFNQSICILPKDYEKVSNDFEVEVYVEDGIDNVDVKIDSKEENKWNKLNRISKHWFKGKVNIKNINDGEHTLFIKSTSLNNNMVYESSKIFFVDKEKKIRAPFKVEILLDNDVYYTQNRMTTVRLRFLVTDSNKKPVSGSDVTASIYEPVLNQKLTLNLKTEADGVATHFYNINEEGILTVAAGVKAYNLKDKEEAIFKNGDCKHIKIYYDKKNK